MSIFDSILDTIKPLTDVYKEIDDSVEGLTGKSISDLAKAYSRGTNTARERNMAIAKAKASALTPQRQDINVQAGKARWGLEDYASDPAAVEQRWQAILTQFVTPNATKGK